MVKNFVRVLGHERLPHIRFHDLRHPADSLMLNHSVAPIVVSKRLGDSKVSVTLDVYGHLMPSMQVEEAQLISDLVTPVQLYPIVPEVPSKA
jgi:integrase